MNGQTWHAIRTSKVEVSTHGRTARPVVLLSQTNYYGDKRWYEIRHDGTVLGSFVDDVQAALIKYEAMKRAARVMLEVKRGLA